MKRNRSLFAMVALVAVVFTGCALLGFSESRTPRQEYYEALFQFDNLLEVYLDTLETAPPELAEELQKNVGPLFAGGIEALEVWRMALRASETEDAVEKRKNYMLLYTKIVDKLFELLPSD